MSESLRASTLKSGTPVFLYWVFDDNDGEVPQLNVKNEMLKQQVFRSYAAESIDELESKLASSPRTINERRLGLVTGRGGDATFHSELDVLSAADGITETLAAGFLNECQDIPTLCERRRESGRAFLDELRNDAETEGRNWVEDLESFIDDLGPEDGLEIRLKNAGVWVEPDHISAD